ncbi:hypothetical protein SAMN05421544_11823 [Riemerella columbipharyngis]|uniref:Uncharacterized protein n=2 Tax=Riemerella columbipharyngis TaxID=1071918 RepID=A0A1G7EYH1_9FLAO|nr:hypothetical protein SAMN05421544_11823 [Riemerella columbipharyngis]
MPFPNHKIVHDYEDFSKIEKHYQQKLIEHCPMFFCEIFMNMEVVQIRSLKTNEYMHGIYFNGNLIGHFYIGKIYSYKEQLAIVEKYMPPKYLQFQEYSRKYKEIDYTPIPYDGYAWIYDRILTEVK